jgi:cell division protein FtsW
MLLKAHDTWLSITAALLIIGGLLMVGSSTSYLALLHLDSPHTLFWRQLLNVGVGAIALVAMVRLRYKKLEDRPRLLWTSFGICVVALVLALFMPEAGGARRWIVIGPFRVQPSEFVKLFVIIYMASTIARNQGRINDLRRLPIPALAVVGTLVVLIAVEPDLSTAAIVAAVAAIMAFVAGLRWKYLATMGLLGCVGVVAAVIAQPYRLERIVDFVLRVLGQRPPSHQVWQSWIALGSGGGTGVGFAQGQQKALFVPAAHTDFIYSIVGEELGLLGTVAILTAFLLIFWRGVEIARKSREPFAAYLALGLSSLLTIQALAHIGVCLGLVPTTGLPLPFISYGGSSLVASMAALGLLINVSAETNLRPSLPNRRRIWRPLVLKVPRGL